MFQRRINKRYQSLATATMADAFIGEAMLKDLSVSGCRIEHTVIINAEHDKHYTLHVKPEADAKIGEFDLAVKLCWVKHGNCASEAGFSVVESPKGKFFQRYVDYLAYRS
ncbi:MAG: PilZ domain-containing protein [Spirochaetaceae bacterium]|nr:PilZ domain-containing protein [Spirochaetaceae bacterium]